MAVLFMAIGILLTGLVGCTTTGGYGDAEFVALETATILKFSDVPIPQGFRLMPNESFAFQNNQLRLALLKYTGKSSTERLVMFFKDQMPLYNWSLINIVEYGSNVLNFQRQDEICTITIVPQGSKSQLVISVTPRTNIAAMGSTETFVK